MFDSSPIKPPCRSTLNTIDSPTKLSKKSSPGLKQMKKTVFVEQNNTIESADESIESKDSFETKQK